LRRDDILTTTTAINILWDDGSYNGNSPVIDYRVSFDQAIGVWVTLVEGITGKNFLATGLTTGLTYSFKV
jgi:hypothetical protein